MLSAIIERLHSSFGLFLEHTSTSLGTLLARKAHGPCSRRKSYSTVCVFRNIRFCTTAAVTIQDDVTLSVTAARAEGHAAINRQAWRIQCRRTRLAVLRPTRPTTAIAKTALVAVTVCPRKSPAAAMPVIGSKPKSSPLPRTR